MALGQAFPTSENAARTPQPKKTLVRPHSRAGQNRRPATTFYAAFLWRLHKAQSHGESLAARASLTSHRITSRARLLIRTPTTRGTRGMATPARLLPQMLRVDRTPARSII